MTNSMPSLKLECQRIMKIIMGKETFHDKQKIGIHNFCQIQFSSQIEINLDHQSKAFRLFSYDPITGHHWMNNLINQLSNQNEINPIQFANLLIVNSNANNEFQQKKESMELQFDSKQQEYEFFNGIPSQAMLISSLEQICKETLLFIVRSFQGQIIYLSIHGPGSDKVSILRKFSEKFPCRTLHVLIDSIDYGLKHNNQISEEGLKIISKQTDLIYLRRQIDNDLPEDSYNYVRYKIFYNSLLEKYTQYQQFEYLQSAILPVVERLLIYFFSLVRQEIPLLYNSFYDQLSLIKSVIQLNYNRGLQKDPSKFNGLQQFQDFIHSQIYILDQMQSKIFKGASLHFPKKLKSPQHCCYCKVHKKIKKSTFYSCQGCQKQSRTIFPLCPECLQPFHEIKEKFKKGQIINFVSQNEKNNVFQQKKMILQPQQKNKINEINQQKILKENQKTNPKQPKRKLGGKIGKNKKIITKKKRSRLSIKQLQNIKQLQQSSQRIFELFKTLKNSKLFYKPLSQNPRNETEFRMELRNEFNFMKSVDLQLRKEFQIFEKQTFMATNVQNDQLQNPESHEKFSKLVKLEYMQQNPQNFYMTKIQQESQQYDQSSQECKERLIDNQIIVKEQRKTTTQR